MIVGFTRAVDSVISICAATAEFSVLRNFSKKHECSLFLIQVHYNFYEMTAADPQHFYVIVCYILCFEIVTTNSRTSTLWKLNADKTKIVEASPFHQVISFHSGSNGAQFITEDDPVFNIITSTVHLGQTWTKHGVEYYCTNCHTVQPKTISTDKYVLRKFTVLIIVFSLWNWVVQW